MQRFHGELPPHKTYVFHRNESYLGKIMKYFEKVREEIPWYMHGCTVAVTFPSYDTDAEICGVGIAQCSYLDQFRKRTGTDIASGRAKKDLANRVTFSANSPKAVFNPKHLEVAKRIAAQTFKSLEWSENV